jgi:hypothetical protein
VTTSHSFRRGDWNARLDTKIVLTCDKENFYVQSDIDAYTDGARIFSRCKQHKIPRDHM